MKLRPDENSKFEQIELVAIPILSGDGPMRHEGRNIQDFRHSSLSPGGRQARRQGCTCPVIHDHRGNCLILVDGVPMTVHRKGCPVHTPVKEFTAERLEREVKRIKKEGKAGLYTYDAQTDSFVPIADMDSKISDEETARVRNLHVERGKSHGNPQ